MGLAEQRGNWLYCSKSQRYSNVHFLIYLSLNLTQEEGSDFVVVGQYHSISSCTHKHCEIKRTEGLFALVFLLLFVCLLTAADCLSGNRLL